MCLTSLSITYYFGEVNFKRIKLNGPYEVGFKEFRSEKLGNMVSVFYPISKEEYAKHIDEPGRNTEFLRHGDKTLLGIAKAAGGYAYGGKGKHVSLHSLRALKFVKTETLNDGTPAIKGKMVPIIYGHGLCSNRGMHTGTGRDYASHGYIVFIIDHQDESCAYTDTSDGKQSWVYNNDYEAHEKDVRMPQINIRVREARALIDEL